MRVYINEYHEGGSFIYSISLAEKQRLFFMPSYQNKEVNRMAKDNNNTSTAVDIRTDKKASDNIIAISSMTEQQTSEKVPQSEKNPEEAVNPAKEGYLALTKESTIIPIPKDIQETLSITAENKEKDAKIVQHEKSATVAVTTRVEQTNTTKEQNEKSAFLKNPTFFDNMDSTEKTAQKDKADQPASSANLKTEKASHSPRASGGSKKDTHTAEEATVPVVVPESPKEAPRANKPEQIVYINLAELHAFKDHPFGVRDDAEMRSLVESVKSGGVNQPALVRPREDGGFEIVAGHRRHKASELAGYTDIPCIVRNMTDDEAVLAMTDDNLRQRSEILPSEKAMSLKMQVEAIKHQGARETSGQNVQKDAGQRSVDVVGERNGMNAKQVQRYVRLTLLTPDLLKAVDEKKLSFTPAVEISYIRPKNQNLIAVSLDGQQSSPSLSQAQRLRELDQKGQLNGDIIDGILCEQKKEVDKVILTTDELSKYFGNDKTPRDMKNQIITLLNEWAGKEKAIAPPEKKAALEK